MNLLIFDEFGHLSHLCPSHFKIPPFIRVERGGGIFALLLHVLLIVKTLRLFVLWWWWWWWGLNIFCCCCVFIITLSRFFRCQQKIFINFYFLFLRYFIYLFCQFLLYKTFRFIYRFIYNLQVSLIKHLFRLRSKMILSFAGGCNDDMR